MRCNQILTLTEVLTLWAGSLRAQSQALDSPRVIELHGVTVKSAYAKWKEDSARNATIYRKELKDAVHKPTIPWKEMKQSMVPVFIVNGLFTEAALRVSGKKKRYQQLKKTIETDQEAGFVSIRYNVQSVSRLTGLPDSSAGVFIHQNPMPISFARSAGELEFMQWVRDRYRAWKR